MTKYMTAKQVCELYRISGLTLYRWCKDEKLGFPQPFVVKRRKLFDTEKLQQWERQRAART